MRFRNGRRLAGFLRFRDAIAVAGPGMVEWNMRDERKKTGYFITCGAGPAVGMELGWEWDSHSHSQVAGSKIVRFGRSGGDPKWPRLHPKGQAARQKKIRRKTILFIILVKIRTR